MPLSATQKKQLKRFAENLRRERDRAGLTQAKLGELSNLNWRTIQKIEAGQLNILLTTICRLQAALRCPWVRLLGDEPTNPSDPLKRARLADRGTTARLPGGHNPGEPP